MNSIKLAAMLFSILFFQTAAGFSFCVLLDGAFDGDWPRVRRWATAWLLLTGLVLWACYSTIKGGLL